MSRTLDQTRKPAVRPKKGLGQHFLTDQTIARNIVDALKGTGDGVFDTLEIGPGMGVLTQYLLTRSDVRLKVMEIDNESVRYLLEKWPQLSPVLYEADFLKSNLSKLFPGKFSIIGNFPYNISSQIFFKVLDYKEQIPEVVCMIQKEVAERIAAPPGSKTYGILSVLLQAWYDIEYLFTVGEGAFIPPPKVKSAVIRLKRNDRIELGCDEILFKSVVKTAFNQRRKRLRNSLKPLIANFVAETQLSPDASTPSSKRSTGKQASTDSIPFAEARPEQLSVEEFITLTQALQQ
jgi:16S rRNA (adenine1518-N6/adenine1519-N6)-dimethyltransferase